VLRFSLRHAFGVFLLCTLLAPLSCAPARYRAKADSETYAIIEEKGGSVPGMEKDFSIETEGHKSAIENLLGDLPRWEQEADFLGEGSVESGAAMLSLEQALKVAVQNSRTYQSQKESLYLEFLSLTLDRHRYAPIFSAGMGGRYDGQRTKGSKAAPFKQGMDATSVVVAAVEDLTGDPATLLNQYADVVSAAGNLAGWDQPQNDFNTDHSVSGDTALGVDLLMKGGGRIALGLASNFFRFVTGDPQVQTGTALTASVTQPLLRGAGRKAAAERLTQAERNALYGLRDFSRFRKSFSVTICSDYYDVLENREVARNSWQSYQNFTKSVARMRSFFEEGQKTKAELGRLEQAELSTQNTWTNAVRRYLESLDRFKIQLGLSTDAAITLDPEELIRLREGGIIHPDISAEDAVQVALAARLDLYNDRDHQEDAERKVAVAANALKPGLDVFGTGRVASDGQDRFQELDFRQAQWSAGLDVDLPFDQKGERNAYRAALITHARALRGYALAEDTVKLEVRAAWRNLDQARRNYAIALTSVELNQSRVEEQDLLAELGRATALDQVDAQNDLTRARNDLISALVNHTIARLAFWRDMGILYIKKNGQWEEVTDVSDN
jgi:outer membrane protein TolC